MMSRMRLIAVIVAVAAAATVRSASAQDAGAFARQGFGTRGVAMGNAMVAVDDASPYYNPALAPFASAQRLDISAATLSFDRSVQTVQFVTPQQRAGFAVGLLHAGVSNIDGRDNAGFHTGMLSIDEFAGFLAFGLRLGSRVSGGISLQAFRTDLFDGLDPVSTIGIDFGFSAAVTDWARVGLVFDDLLARYDWDTSSLYSEGGKASRDNFPRRIRLGASMTRLDGRLLLAFEFESAFSSIETFTRRVSVLGNGPVELLDAERITVREDLVRIGFEVRPIEIVRVRAGVDRLGTGGARPAAGLSVDQPIGNLGARFTYTFADEPYGMGTAHYAGLQLTFE